MTPAMLDVRNLTTELVGPDNSIRLIDDVNPVSYTHLTLPTKA